MRSKTVHTLVAVAALAAFSPAAFAATTTVANDAAYVEQDDDDEFPWGLIGVIGLAGLIPRKRDDHVTVYNRTRTGTDDTRPRT